jgi:hypothetical protein
LSDPRSFYPSAREKSGSSSWRIDAIPARARPYLLIDPHTKLNVATYL